MVGPSRTTMRRVGIRACGAHPRAPGSVIQKSWTTQRPPSNQFDRCYLWRTQVEILLPLLHCRGSGWNFQRVYKVPHSHETHFTKGENSEPAGGMMLLQVWPPSSVHRCNSPPVSEKVSFSRDKLHFNKTRKKKRKKKEKENIVVRFPFWSTESVYDNLCPRWITVFVIRTYLMRSCFEIHSENSLENRKCVGSVTETKEISDLSLP